MIGHGKYRDIFLYEVTRQDLLFEPKAASGYSVGNVLMFADKRSVALGREFARADDLSAAREYLDQRTRRDAFGDAGHEDQLAPQVNMGNEGLLELTAQIAQRDELLRDLTETLNAQRQDNELLHRQLAKAHERLAVDELKQNELVGDLQYASSENHTIESALERVMEEKYQLEQELAERITELIELNLQNDELRRHLKEPGKPTERVSGQPAMNGAEAARPSYGKQQEAPATDGRVVTMASGGQIHIFHEFPATPKRPLAARAYRAALSALCVCAIAFAAVLVLGAISVVATAQANNITLGAALDLVLKSLYFLAMWQAPYPGVYPSR